MVQDRRKIDGMLAGDVSPYLDRLIRNESWLARFRGWIERRFTRTIDSVLGLVLAYVFGFITQPTLSGLWDAKLKPLWEVLKKILEQ